MSQSSAELPVTLLCDIEARQEAVLKQLDELNEKIEQALALGRTSEEQE